jgi:hypothetical protein
MNWLNNIFRLETQTGEPQTFGDITITPQTRALIIRWPFGGFVWNRPVGVFVDRAGQIERLPIIDVTRYALWSLAGLSALFSVIITMLVAQRRS